MDVWGPTHTHVDPQTGWLWANPGGDWLDADLNPQGTRAWATVAANAVAGASAVARYTDQDVTRLVQHCQQDNRWLAVIMRRGSAPRAIAGPFSTLGAPPSIRVRYASGRVAELRCRLVAAISAGSNLPRTTSDSSDLPCFVEFDRPTEPVESALMDLTVTEHWSGSNPVIELFLCNPAAPVDPATGADGLARLSGTIDAGLSSVAGVIGVQRYVDGSSFSEFVAVDARGSTTSESAYDPALWGGTSDLTKFPHTVVNRWVGAPAGLSLVNSGYRGEGFAPLAPGLGALKLVMADEVSSTGQEVGYTGTPACNARLFMPFEEMGLLNRLFVRQYVRLGTPHARTTADRVEVLQDGRPKWTDIGGKFGIAPSHVTTYGGVSGSSGGGRGWQMRWAWSECDAGAGGPDEGGVMLGWHLFDFQSSNPVGHRYGSESQSRNNWGLRGGIGSVLYAGQWYCVETELKLNTVRAADNSFEPDGALRTWIDGRLVYERTGMVFRTLPLHTAAYNPSFIRPMRELGIKELWWNWYHGGTTKSTVERTVFVTGLAWARERIGPMVLA
jgi:hypothetical protein